MKRLSLVFVAAAAMFSALAQKHGNPFAGRWDITVTAGNVTYPDWMEVVDKQPRPDVRVQPRGGSVRPVADARMEGSVLILTLTPAAGNRPAVTWELNVAGDRLTGTQKRGDGVNGQLTGVRAPALKRNPPKAWTNPEPLFNGKDLSGWEAFPAASSHWAVRDGLLVNESKGANLKTTRKFDDFKLHVEFNCPDDGNSGIYLRGRYEVQVEYVPPGREDAYHMMGAVYGMVPVKAELPRKPGEWESFDITLVGRYVTIVRNGVTTIDNQEIAGITGGALDADEGAPGPFYIQGDHTGGIKFRNITIAVPR
jgi:Domain of Unknown Function (DUF1080)